MFHDLLPLIWPLKQNNHPYPVKLSRSRFTHQNSANRCSSLQSMGSETSKVGHTKTGGNKKQSSSPVPRHIIPPSIKVANSVSCNENLLSVDFGTRRRNSSRSSIELDVNRSRSESICSARSNSKQKHPIPVRNRQLIQSCFQNPHEILGRKILKRACEKRNDFAQFYAKLDNDQKDDIEEEVKVLLKKTVANINFIDEVQRLAEEFGSKHVKYRMFGFKTDFFGAYADATITECTFLDNAVHPAHQTLTAFSSFITMVYSSVRDGFYAEMRRMRRASNSFSTGSNSSYRRKMLSTDCNSVDFSPRSASPDDSGEFDDLSGVIINTTDSDSFLKPPTVDY